MGELLASLRGWGVKLRLSRGSASLGLRSPCAGVEGTGKQLSGGRRARRPVRFASPVGNLHRGVE